MHKHLPGQHSQQSHAGKLSSKDIRAILLATPALAHLGEISVQETPQNSFSDLDIRFGNSQTVFVRKTSEDAICPALGSNPSNMTTADRLDVISIANTIAKSLGIAHIGLHTGTMPYNYLAENGYSLHNQTIKKVINTAAYADLVTGFSKAVREKVKDREANVPQIHIERAIQRAIDILHTLPDNGRTLLAEMPTIATYGIIHKKIFGFAYTKVS